MFVCPECGASASQAGRCAGDDAELVHRGEDHLLGQQLDRYRVARRVGAGGMGTVYLAVQPSIGGRVAIKVLTRVDLVMRGARDLQAQGTERPSEDMIARFFNEARTVNRIRHDNIVNVLDLAQLPDGRPYMVMEFLDGVPLSDIFASRRQLPLGKLAQVAEETLAALRAAHRKNVVHRDLKPENIFVTRAGRTKVLDFGVAKLFGDIRLTGSGPRTDSGIMLGTPQYMSPEQIIGDSVPFDGRADLYSVGAILYEGATGQRPFEDPNLYELCKRILEQPPLSPRELRPDLPEAYEQVIMRALAKHADDRFADAKQMALALREASRGLPRQSFASSASARRDELDASSLGPLQSEPSPRASSPQNSSASLAFAKTAAHAPDSSGARTNAAFAPAARAPAPAPVAEPQPAREPKPYPDPQPRARAGRRGLWVGALIAALVGVGVAVALILSR